MNEIELLRRQNAIGLITVRQIPEHTSWCNMRQRCRDQNTPHYNRYGGRNIQVCDEWKDNFWAFFQHVGRKPSPDHSIDRINNDGNYEPGNVKWSTALQQRHNRSVEPDFKGELHPSAKLNWNIVGGIRERFAVGDISQQALADEFGVSQFAISKIIRNKSWRL